MGGQERQIGLGLAAEPESLGRPSLPQALTNFLLYDYPCNVLFLLFDLCIFLATVHVHVYLNTLCLKYFYVENLHVDYHYIVFCIVVTYAVNSITFT